MGPPEVDTCGQFGGAAGVELVVAVIPQVFQLCRSAEIDSFGSPQTTPPELPAVTCVASALRPCESNARSKGPPRSEFPSEGTLTREFQLAASSLAPMVKRMWS